MKQKILSFLSILLAIALAITVFCNIKYRHETEDSIAALQRQIEEKNHTINKLEKALVNKQKELKNEFKIDSSDLLKQQDNIQEQCFQEMIWQAWGLNFLYCKELELPIIRTVADDHWNLITDASINNFTTQNLELIEVSLCSSYVEISAFYYLPIHDNTLACQENPPESGWIKLYPNSDGNYLLPLNEAEEIDGCKCTAIKYSIGDYDTYYGIISTFD